MKKSFVKVSLILATASLVSAPPLSWSFSETAPDDFPLTQISDDFASTDYYLVSLDAAYNPVFDEYLLAYNVWITGEQDIYLQRVDGQGQPLGAGLNLSNDVNGTLDTRHTYRAPSIAVDPVTGSYLIAYATNDSGTAQGKTLIYATLLSHDLDNVNTQRVSIHSADDNPDMDAYEPTAVWVGGDNPWRVAWSGEQVRDDLPGHEAGEWEIWLAALDANGERATLPSPADGLLFVENARMTYQGPDGFAEYVAFIPRLIPATGPAGEISYLWLAWRGTAATEDDMAEEVYVMPIGLDATVLAEPRRVSPYSTAPNPEVNAFDLAWSQDLQTLAVSWSTGMSNGEVIPDAVEQERAQLGLALVTLQDGQFEGDPLNVTAMHQELEFLPGTTPSVIGGPQALMRGNRLQVAYEAWVVPDGAAMSAVEQEIMMTEIELSSSTSLGAASYQVISRIGEDGDDSQLILPFSATASNLVTNPMLALAGGPGNAAGDTSLAVWGAKQAVGGPDEVYGQFIHSEQPAADEEPEADEDPTADEDPADEQPTAGGSQNPPPRSSGGGSADLLMLLLLTLAALSRTRPTT